MYYATEPSKRKWSNNLIFRTCTRRRQKGKIFSMLFQIAWEKVCFYKFQVLKNMYLDIVFKCTVTVRVLNNNSCIVALIYREKN